MTHHMQQEITVTTSSPDQENDTDVFPMPPPAAISAPTQLAPGALGGVIRMHGREAAEHGLDATFEAEVAGGLCGLVMAWTRSPDAGRLWLAGPAGYPLGSIAVTRRDPDPITTRPQPTPANRERRRRRHRRSAQRPPITLRFAASAPTGSSRRVTHAVRAHDVEHVSYRRGPRPAHHPDHGRRTPVSYPGMLSVPMRRTEAPVRRPTPHSKGVQ
jgi:hypothetical protein